MAIIPTKGLMLAGGAALATAIVSTAALAQSSEKAAPGAEQGAAKTESRDSSKGEVDIQSNWLKPSQKVVTPARQIIGRDLTDSDGIATGKIKYLMIRMGTGKLIYALTSSPNSFEFTAVPWEAINKEDWLGWRNPGLKLDVSADEIKDMPKMSVDRFYELISPIFAKETADRFGVKIEADTKEDETYFVMGMTASGTLSKPLAQVDNQIAGSMVVDAKGKEIGQIDRVMVDVEEGYVPYLLVSQGGFLAMGERWLPVPPQALTWNANDSARYALEKPAGSLSEIKDVAAQTLAVSVHLSDLGKLYEFYGIQPYWRERQ